jgi:hypothetical protein
MQDCLGQSGDHKVSRAASRVYICPRIPTLDHSKIITNLNNTRGNVYLFHPTGSLVFIANMAPTFIFSFLLSVEPPLLHNTPPATVDPCQH